MVNYKLVLPEDLNQFGYLFGGSMLKWVDEYAWIAASLAYPGCRFVTIAMDEVVFKKSVGEGTILAFVIQKSRARRTSVQYQVDVFYAARGSDPENRVFSTHVTLVNVDEEGRKQPLPEQPATTGGGGF